MGDTVRDLQAALDFFTHKCDTSKLVKRLDDECKAAAEKLEKSAKTRKQLAEETKETKRSASSQTEVPAVLDAFSKLLKLYQTEIDFLTKRAKSAEATLGEVYETLYEAPPVAPIIQQAIASDQALSKHKFETVKLQAELSEFESEFSNLKNQDITIRQLEDQIVGLQEEIAKKEKVEAMASELVKEKMVEDQDTRRELDEMKEFLDRAEKDAQEQRKAADTARAELYEMRSQYEEKDASRQAEIDLLQEELNSARQASQSESEVLRLRKIGVEEEERERKRREDELTRLYSALDAARVETSKAREAEEEASMRRVRELAEQKQRYEENLLREREKVQELERTLRSKNEHEASEEKPGKNDLKAEEQQQQSNSFETLVAQLRVSLSEKEAELEQSNSNLLILEERLGDQQELIRKLQQAELTGGSASNPVIATSTSGNVTTSPTSFHVEQGGSELVSILQEQRDRFRRKVLELEQELESVSGKERRSREILEKTRNENAALAERVRALRNSGQRITPGMLESGSANPAGGRSPLQIILRFVSANSFARSALVVYVTALHLLVLASQSSSGEMHSKMLRKGAD